MIFFIFPFVTGFFAYSVLFQLHTFSPQVRVRAMNPLGWSDWSDRATVETAKPTLTDMQQSGQKLGFFQIISAIPEGYEELIKCVHRVLLLLSTDIRALVCLLFPKQ